MGFKNPIRSCAVFLCASAKRDPLRNMIFEAQIAKNLLNGALFFQKSAQNSSGLCKFLRNME